MKLLHIVPSMDPIRGGVCQAIRTLIFGLEAHSIINEVVTVDQTGINKLASDKFKIYELGPYKSSWFYSPKLLPWLKEHVNNYDVVILHGLWSYNVSACISVFRYKKKIPKLFVMPHGMLDPYFQKSPDRKVKALRNLFFWNLFERTLINTISDGLLFTCTKELELAETTFSNYQPKNVYNVGLGVASPPIYSQNMSDFFYQIVPNVSGKPFLLFLSRIQQKKGVDLLINSYNELSKKNLDLPNIVIAGPGLESDYGKSMVELASGNSNIHFSGMLTGEAKWGAFYNCDAFILPSHQENFGIAIVEALACSKPVLISNQVNIYKEIEESCAGLIENDSEFGTISLIDKWHHKSEVDRNIMRKNAKEVYLNTFSIETASIKFNDFLMGLFS